MTIFKLKTVLNIDEPVFQNLVKNVNLYIVNCVVLCGLVYSHKKILMVPPNLKYLIQIYFSLTILTGTAIKIMYEMRIMIKRALNRENHQNWELPIIFFPI